MPYTSIVYGVDLEFLGGIEQAYAGFNPLHESAGKLGELFIYKMNIVGVGSNVSCLGPVAPGQLPPLATNSARLCQVCQSQCLTSRNHTADLIDAAFSPHAIHAASCYWRTTCCSSRSSPAGYPSALDFITLLLDLFTERLAIGAQPHRLPGEQHPCGPKHGQACGHLRLEGHRGLPVWDVARDHQKEGGLVLPC